MIGVSPTIHLWIFRIAIVSLTLLAFIYFRRDKTKSSLIILAGMILIFIGALIDYISFLVLFPHKEFRYIWYKITVTGKYILSVGFIVAVIGSYLNVLIGNSKPLPNVKTKNEAV